MKLSELSGLFHGTSLLIIGAIITLTLVMIVVIARYLVSDSPEKNLDE
jgi:hypothetical protein